MSTSASLRPSNPSMPLRRGSAQVTIAILGAGRPPRAESYPTARAALALSASSIKLIRILLLRSAASAKRETYPSAPGASNRRRPCDRRCRPIVGSSWYRRGSRSVPAPAPSVSMPWSSPGAAPSSVTRNGTGASVADRSTRFASRAWKRNMMRAPASLEVIAPSPMVHSPSSAQLLRPSDFGAV